MHPACLRAKAPAITAFKPALRVNLKTQNYPENYQELESQKPIWHLLFSLPFGCGDQASFSGEGETVAEGGAQLSNAPFVPS